MLDDSCSDFFAMLDHRPPGEDASGPIAWLADGANQEQEAIENLLVDNIDPLVGSYDFEIIRIRPIGGDV
jgi:hypothetical protein